ncbi:Acg family FMN-binding oxidoreductase [Paucibacter sp. B51]|uniref:Acg family FMN-binding oxidoreductase n=1 Tax=Paucibacter sp. B51 TaxID=2993315 RepID=UPI0022EBDD2E|nr:twin-arginine translocation pathway signal protein [Paucibacter sp. B51]
MSPRADGRQPARRAFIRLLGGGVVGAALPLSGCTQEVPPPALSAWQEPVQNIAGDVRHWLLAHALLAPNPHNRQPWLADLRESGQILLICDGERLLPETDPWGRQILIGCGAFIELAVIAAAERGIRLQVEAFPNGEPTPFTLPGGQVIARLRLRTEPGLARDPLFAQIRRRHTHKGLYDSSRSVSAEQWQTLRDAAVEAGAGLRVGAVTDGKTMDALRRITREAFETEMLTPRTYLESARLMRIGPAEVEQHRDGIALMGGMVRLSAALGLFNRFEVPRADSSSMAQIRKRWAAFETASGYLWIVSEDNSRAAQLRCGRAYVRSHLRACAAGLDMHPLSQALQEYAEVRPQLRALRQLLACSEDSPETVQMLARVGYGLEAASPAPRRELRQMFLS